MFIPLEYICSQVGQIAWDSVIVSAKLNRQLCIEYTEFLLESIICYM